MKFSTLLVNQKTNERNEKIFTEEELKKIVGDFVISRAIDRGETNTTIINNGQTYKMYIKYLKN